MNATARALPYSETQLFIPKSGIILCLLLAMITLSAFSVIYIKDLNRRLFSEAQLLHHERDSLRVEWGQLLLEQGTLTRQARIQQIAQQQLEMHVPTSNEITMVKE